MMEAIVLAAGKGKRITQLLNGRPKCMLPVGDSLLIDRIIENLMALKVESIVICCGYGAKYLRQHLLQHHGAALLRFVYNPFYGYTNNSVSLLLAQFKVRGDFLLINGDNLVEREIFQRVIAYPGTVIPIIKKPAYDREDMKVTVDQKGNVTAINKRIKTGVYGEAIGIRKIAACDRRSFWAALRHLVLIRLRYNAFYTEAFQSLIDQGHRLPALEVSDCYYDEVDNATDLKRVQQAADRNSIV